MHVELVDSEFYKRRLRNALAMASASAAAAITEVTHLLELLLLEAAPGLALSELEQQLRDATNLDLGNVLWAVKRLRKLNLKSLPLGKGKVIDPRDEFTRIEQALGAITGQHVIAGNEVWFRLELQVDRHLMR